MYMQTTNKLFQRNMFFHKGKGRLLRKNSESIVYHK